jgi:hypothetical protein
MASSISSGVFSLGRSAISNVGSWAAATLSRGARARLPSAPHPPGQGSRQLRRLLLAHWPRLLRAQMGPPTRRPGRGAGHVHSTYQYPIVAPRHRLSPPLPPTL